MDEVNSFDELDKTEQDQEGSADSSSVRPLVNLSGPSESDPKRALEDDQSAAGSETTGDVLEGSVSKAFLPSDFIILPEVPITKDHTAQIKSELEYEVLLEKCGGTLCTFFYSESDKASRAMKQEIIELARTLGGNATFAFVNSDKAKEYIDKAHLSKKLPTFVIADYKKSYIHPYFNISETKDLQKLIEGYQRGDKKSTLPLPN